ncbi:MAG: cache domain-containing protein, partial [Spirochaetaceae bacterium]
MRQRLKISLSLLISLLLCGGFAVFSFTRLFNVVETTFFQPQIEKERQAQLEQIAGRVGRYHRDNIEHFQPLVQKDYTWNTFRPSNQLARDDIEDLQIEIGGLLDLYPNIQLIRFLGSDGKSIHFSTLNSDIESQDQQRRKYLDYDRTGESIGSALLLPPGGDSPGVVIDGGDQRFIYSLPVNRSGDFRGVVLFYVSKRDLLEYLLRFPALDVRELSLLGEQGIVFNVSPGKLASIQSELSEIWRENESIDSVYSEPVPFEVKVEPDETIQQEAQVEGRRENYNLLSINTDEFGTLSLLIPYSVFQLQPIMKVVVIAAIFLTVFLILYLVLNLRQDPVLILSQRIKRLQLDILREFIEGKERVDWKQWQKKLQDNRGELKSRIKRGVGRIPSQKGAAIDSMIDRSWDEIISIIETRVGGVQPEAPDIRHIEELLQRALEGAQLTVQAPALQTPKAQPRRAGIVVEEIGVDEVVEPGEVIPSEEAEEIEEAEAVEEAEELGEAEEL